MAKAARGNTGLQEPLPAPAHSRGAEEAACMVTATTDRGGALRSGPELATTVIPPHETGVSPAL